MENADASERAEALKSGPEDALLAKGRAPSAAGELDGAEPDNTSRRKTWSDIARTKRPSSFECELMCALRFIRQEGYL